VGNFQVPDDGWRSETEREKQTRIKNAQKKLNLALEVAFYQAGKGSKRYAEYREQCVKRHNKGFGYFDLRCESDMFPNVSYSIRLIIDEDKEASYTITSGIYVVWSHLPEKDFILGMVIPLKTNSNCKGPEITKADIIKKSVCLLFAIIDDEKTFLETCGWAESKRRYSTRSDWNQSYELTSTFPKQGIRHELYNIYEKEIIKCQEKHEKAAKKQESLKKEFAALEEIMGR
jgi:hypothetical protein